MMLGNETERKNEEQKRGVAFVLPTYLSTLGTRKPSIMAG